MRHRSVAVLAAAVLAIPLVAADHIGTPPTGTASTSMTAIELEVTGLPGLVVLDGATSATTVDTPWGGSSVTGLRVGTTGFSTAEAASDASTSDDTALLDVATTATGWVGAVNPLAASAGADTGSAWSLFDAANVELGPQVEVGALAGGLAAQVDAASASSAVDGTAASARQSLELSGVRLTLGGLVESLDQLPLDSILALVDELGLTLPVDPVAAIGAVQDAADAVAVAADAAIAAGDPFGDGATGPVADHVAATANEPDVEALQQAYDDLGEVSLATVGDLITIMAADGPVPSATDCGVSLTPLPLTVEELDATVAALQGCIALAMEPLVSPFLDDPGDFDAATGLTDLQQAIADLAADIAQLVADLEVALDALAAAVTSLQDVLAEGDLVDLLTALEGLVADLGATPLVEISELSVAVEAIAAETADASSATIGCTVDVAVLGTPLGPQSCDDTIDPVLGLAALLNSAIGDVRDLLAALPLGGSVDLADVTADAFVDPTEASVCPEGGAYQRVCEVDGTVHAIAGVRLLEVAIPTMSVDPAEVTRTVETALTEALDTLDTLDADALETDVAGLITSVDALVTGAGLAGLEPTYATWADGLAEAATAAKDSAAALAADLDGSTIGALSEPIDTPAVSLSIDPVSVASFTAGVSAEDEDPVGEDEPVDEGTEDDTPVDGPVGDDPVDGAPDPVEGSPDPVEGAPDPEVPNLPHTGGGLALAGLMSLLGAAALRRRW